MEFIKELLKQNQIEFTNIEQQNDNHDTFNFEFQNKKFTIKIAVTDAEKKLLKNEQKINTVCNFDFLPKIFKYGKYKNTFFIIYDFVEGKTVFNIWEKSNLIKKEEILQKLSVNLAKIHKFSQVFLQKQFCDYDWLKRWQIEFKKLIKLFEKFNLNVLELKNFLEFNLPKIFKQNKYCLVCNDVDFNSMIYNNNSLIFTNFKKARYCPVDYEINNIIFNLKKINYENEKTIFNQNEINFILDTIKKYYPKLFEVEYLNERLTVYDFYSNIKYALKTDEPSLVETELNAFNEFCKSLSHPKRPIFENVKNEIIELSRIYNNDNNFDIYNNQIKKVYYFVNKLIKNKNNSLNAKALNLASLLYNSSLLCASGNYYDYHITSCDKAKEILQKYACDEKTINTVIGCILNHKDAKNSSDLNEKSFANAFNEYVFSNTIDYCKFLLNLNPKLKFDEIKEELTSRFNELNNFRKKPKKLKLDKIFNQIYDTFFKNELNDNFYKNNLEKNNTK